MMNARGLLFIFDIWKFESQWTYLVLIVALVRDANIFETSN